MKSDQGQVSSHHKKSKPIVHRNSAHKKAALKKEPPCLPRAVPKKPQPSANTNDDINEAWPEGFDNYIYILTSRRVQIAVNNLIEILGNKFGDELKGKSDKTEIQGMRDIVASHTVYMALDKKLQVKQEFDAKDLKAKLDEVERQRLRDCNTINPAKNTIVDIVEAHDEMDRNESEIDLSKADTQFIREISSVLPEGKTIGDNGISIEEALRFNHWLTSRPDFAEFAANLMPIMRRVSELFRMTQQLYASTVLAPFIGNRMDTLQVTDYSQKLIKAAKQNVPSWWDNCEIIRTPESISVRFPTARHQRYNPKGITLLCVLNEITAAIERNIVWPSYIEAAIYWRKVKNLKGKPDCLDPMSAILSGSQSAIDGIMDVVRLDFIRRHPSALIVSPEHQDAVARWHYAAWYGSASDRKLAREFLMMSQSRVKKRGRHKSKQVDIKQLSQACKDLTEYIRGLNEAMHDCKTKEEVLGIFPDCEFLALDLATGDWVDQITVRTLNKRPFDPLQPKTEAMAFIARHIGFNKTVIYDLLKSYSSKP